MVVNQESLDWRREQGWELAQAVIQKDEMGGGMGAGKGYNSRERFVRENRDTDGKEMRVDV
jgi:hypothetical protein